MLTYCLVCKRNAKNLDSKVSKNKTDRIMLLSKWAACSKQLRFMKEQEWKVLLSSLGLKITLKKIPILGDILF